MSKRPWLIILLGLLVLAGCRTQQTTLINEVKPVLPAGERRPVEVVLASPQGLTTSTNDYDSVTVVFNQAMHPLSALPKDGPKGPLTLEPQVSGTYHWKGTATLEFRPSKPLPFGTKFVGKVAKGTKSWAETELAQDYQFEFITPGPILKGSVPAGNAQGVSPKANVRLVFNQPMDADKAKESVLFYRLDAKTGKTVDVPFKLRAATAADFDQEQQDPPVAQSLILEPSSLEGETSYSVKLKEGLMGQQGSQGASKVELITFTTYGPLRLTNDIKSSDNPEQGYGFHFTNPVKMSDLVANLKIEPAVELPEGYAQDSYEWSDLFLYLDFEPRKTYKLSLSGKLKDAYGNELGKDVELTLTTTDYQPRAGMAEGLGVLEAAGPRVIPLGLRNFKSYHLRLAGIPGSQVQSVVTSDKAFWTSKAYTPPGGFKVDKDVPVKTPLNEAVDRPVDLKAALGGSRYGYVYYQVQVGSASNGWNFRGLAQVTNLGLTAKFSPENIVVLAASLDGGKPLPKVAVQVRDDNGKVLWKGVTDKEGLVQAPGWAKLGLKATGDWGGPSLWVFANQGKDETFVRSNGFGGISPWMFDQVSYDWDQQKVEYGAHAFSERGLYRPGEEVFLKGTMRQKAAGRWQLPEVKQVHFKLTDSRDKEVVKGTLPVNSFGSFDQQLDLPKDCPTGTYQVAYSLDGGRYLCSESFRVEAFEPAQFEVTVEAGDGPLVAGDSYEFDIKGWYLFGAPMQGEPGTWTARLEPHTIQPEGYDGYDFGPGYFGDETPDEATKLANAAGKLDDKGLLHGQVKLDGMTFKGDGLLVVEGTVTSPTRQQLSGRKRIPVHRGEFHVGLRPSSSFVPTKKAVDLDLVAISPKGDTLQGKSVKVEMVRREWNSVRKADVGGAYRWVVETQDKVLDTFEVRSAVKPATFQLTPPEPGFYLVRATANDGRNNNILTTSYFYAYGDGYVPWGRSDDDVIELVADKNRYAPGDTARILVKSPYEKATALITVERELIMERYVRDLEGSAATFDLPIQSEHLPNVYVSVVLLQGRIPDKGFTEDGDDLGKPSFKIGYLNLPVTAVEKRLTVKVKPDRETYGPGEEVKASLEVVDQDGKPVKAEVSLSVADQGVLGLIGYQTPDYFDSFYGIRSLRVRTAETRLDVIGQRSYGTKGENDGGGGGFNAPYREDFRYTAYWNPSIETDDQGKASVAFNLPENLTTFRLMATAATPASQFGSGESKLVVNKPLLMKPSIPRFARVGDSFQAGVLAFNNSDKQLGVTITVKAEGVERTGHTSTTIALEPGQEQEVLFPFKSDKPGEAVLKFDAVMGAEHDGLKLTFPVQLPQATESVATSGSLTEDRKDEKVEVPPDAVPGTTTLTIRLASTALGGLDNSVMALLEYPYGCLEQTMSRVAPLVLAEELVLAYDFEGYDQAKVKTRVQTALDSLPNFQLENGGYGLWTDSKYANPYATAYALQVAKLSADRGYKVNQSSLKKAREFLRKFMQGEIRLEYPISDDELLALKASGGYARAVWGDLDAATVSNLYGKRDKLPLVGKLYLLKTARLTKQKEVVATLERELTNAVKIEAETAHFEVDPNELSWLYSTNIRDTALILQALLEGEKEFPVADKVVRWLSESRTRSGGWGSTQNNFAAIYALVTYQKRYEKDPADFTARAVLGDKELVSEVFKGRQTQVKSSRTELGQEQSGTLSLVKQGKGRLYYGLTMTYAPAVEMPPRDEGMAVFKTISRLSDGKAVADLEAGKTYKVTLSVVTPRERHFVVVEDPIPAGTEIVQSTFETESDEMRELLRLANVSAWYTFNHFESYDDRVLLFADGLAAGEYTYEYLIRARLPGDYAMPATKVEQMYHAEVFGTTSKQTVKIR